MWQPFKVFSIVVNVLPYTTRCWKTNIVFLPNGNCSRSPRPRQLREQSSQSSFALFPAKHPRVSAAIDARRRVGRKKDNLEEKRLMRVKRSEIYQQREGPSIMSHREKLDITEVSWHWCLQRLQSRPITDHMSTVWVFLVSQRRHFSLLTPQATLTKASVCQMYNAAFCRCQKSPCWMALHSAGLPSGRLWSETSRLCILFLTCILKKFWEFVELHVRVNASTCSLLVS